MKEFMEFNYVEVDGLLYPRIEIEGKEVLNDLGKYGRMRLDYLWEHRPVMYREMLVSGNWRGIVRVWMSWDLRWQNRL